MPSLREQAISAPEGACRLRCTADRRRIARLRAVRRGRDGIGWQFGYRGRAGPGWIGRDRAALSPPEERRVEVVRAAPPAPPVWGCRRAGGALLAAAPAAPAGPAAREDRRAPAAAGRLAGAAAARAGGRVGWPGWPGRAAPRARLAVAAARAAQRDAAARAEVERAAALETRAARRGGRRGQRAAILGATPPMGWNSWNMFQCNISESLIKGMADAMVSSGMKDVGYQYVNLDDCWMDGRDASGKLQLNTSKFPSGIPALADYVHGKGLKIGIYAMPNTKTCAGIYGGSPRRRGQPRSRDHRRADVRGVGHRLPQVRQVPRRRSAGSRSCATRCERPGARSSTASTRGPGPGCTPTSCSIDLVHIANMWRIGFDISANWDSVIRLIDKNKPEYVGAGPGHWNDPDMLEVGKRHQRHGGARPFQHVGDHGGAADRRERPAQHERGDEDDADEQRGDRRRSRSDGRAGKRVATPGTNLEVWSKPLSGTNMRAVALFNRGSGPASITVQWSALGIPTGAATVRDLWATPTWDRSAALTPPHRCRATASSCSR